MEYKHPFEFERAGARAYRQGRPYDSNPYAAEADHGVDPAHWWSWGWIREAELAQGNVVRPARWAQ